MIIKPKLTWVRMLFSLKGSSLSRTWPRITVITAFSIFVTWFEIHYKVDQQHFSLTTQPFTLIGLVLGIFLGFRNHAAYDRYWEGRKLWGRLVNASRSLARQALTLAQAGQDESNPASCRHFQTDLIHRQIAYVHALRHHLRDTDSHEDLAPFLDPEERQQLQTQKNIPIAILQSMGERIRRAWDAGWISEYHLPVIEGTLTTLTDIQGGCERIKNTPIPWVYTVLTHRIVAFYCFFLPFGIIKDVQELTPLVVMLISHAFFGLDEIGDEIEDPFGTEPQHLPLTALCRTIEVNLRQALDEKEIPEMLKPVNGILD